MSKSPLELVAQARIAEYRERALANSRVHHGQPSSSFWNRFAIRRVRTMRSVAWPPRILPDRLCSPEPAPGVPLTPPFAMIACVSAETASTPLVGRAEEMRRLAALIGLGDEPGTGGHVLLGGDAGVGKSRLIAELSTKVQDSDWRVLVGHCLDFGDSALPYLPFSEAFGRLAAEQSELATALVEASPAIARLLPAHRMLTERVEQQEPTEPAALFDAVSATLAELGRQAPLLVVVEDVHWADRSTRNSSVSFSPARSAHRSSSWPHIAATTCTAATLSGPGSANGAAYLP